MSSRRDDGGAGSSDSPPRAKGPTARRLARSGPGNGARRQEFESTRQAGVCPAKQTAAGEELVVGEATLAQGSERGAEDPRGLPRTWNYIGQEAHECWEIHFGLFARLLYAERLSWVPRGAWCMS